jgi:urease accessory protein
VRASARVEVVRRDGRDVLINARSEPPFAIRRTGDRIVLVGSAAAPVGGDILDIDVIVGAGASAEIGTVAATSIWPGPCGDRSLIRTMVTLGEGAQLVWWPEPLVSIVDSDHRSSTHVDLENGARCTILEEVSLGRSGQESGRLELDLRVQRDGHPILHHTERFGPDELGAGSAVGVGNARHVISGVVVGGDAGEPVTIMDQGGGAHGAWLPVAADAAMVLVVAPDRPVALDLLARLRPVAFVQGTNATGCPAPGGSEAGEAS